jgi:uncharacterized protein (DUF3084 family)
MSDIDKLYSTVQDIAKASDFLKAQQSLVAELKIQKDKLDNDIKIIGSNKVHLQGEFEKERETKKQELVSLDKLIFIKKQDMVGMDNHLTAEKNRLIEIEKKQQEDLFIIRQRNKDAESKLEIISKIKSDIEGKKEILAKINELIKQL